MRKHLIWTLALGMVVVAAGVAYATDSTGSDFSLLKMKATPSKHKLFVETSTLSNSNPGTPTSPGNVPVATKDVKLAFPKDFTFTNKGLAQCKQSLEQTTTETAKSLCGKAQVGSGQATACLGQAGTPCSSKLAFVVTAFNGKPKGGKPTIILHSRNDANSLTTVLVGTLDQKKNILDVPIPASVYTLATITDFQTTVSKAYKSGSKKLNYFQAKCKSGKWTLNGTFTYNSSDPADHPTATQSCKK